MLDTRFHYPDFEDLYRFIAPHLRIRTGGGAEWLAPWGHLARREFGNKKGFRLYLLLYEGASDYDLPRLRYEWGRLTPSNDDRSLDAYNTSKYARDLGWRGGFQGENGQAGQVRTRKIFEEEEIGRKTVEAHADVPKLHSLNFTKLAEQEPPPRKWLVRDMIPMGNVTLLSGDGSAGKSLIMKQLCVATITGTAWFGRMVEQPGAAVYITCEDDHDELWRRFADICRETNTPLGSLKVFDGKNPVLLAHSIVGENAVLAAPEGRSNILKPSKFFESIQRFVQEGLRADKIPSLVVLDAAADLFAGNENDRAQVRQFITMLRRFCIQYSTAVVLIAHPSVSGMASGRGYSGSTGWNNSTRSRLYMSRVYDENGKEPDPDVRTLTVLKANYAQRGQELDLRYRNGIFYKTGGGESGVMAAMAAEKAEAKFLELLVAYESEGRYVNDSPSGKYAPRLFASDDRANGIKKIAFELAMSRLFAKGKIMIVSFGKASEPKKKIILPPPPPR